MQTVANPQTTIPRRLLDRYLREASEAVARRNEELGRRIRAARDLKRWKQKELARALHVEPVTVSRWERGENTPDLGKLETLAQVLDQPLSYFVEPPAATEQPTPAVVLARLDKIETTLESLQQVVLAALEERGGRQASG